MSTHTYHVTGLHCDACVQRVQKALTPYALAVNVTLNPPRVQLHQATATLERLNVVLQEIGDYQLSESAT